MEDGWSLCWCHKCIDDAVVGMAVLASQCLVLDTVLWCHQLSSYSREERVVWKTGS